MNDMIYRNSLSKCKQLEELEELELEVDESGY